METPKWLIALVAATSFALAACDNAQTTSKERPRPSLTGRDIQGDTARSYDVQQQTLNDARVLLDSLQKEAKNLNSKWGFWNVKEVRQQKVKWQGVQGQLTELRKDLDESDGNTELKQSVDDLTRTVGSALRQLDKLIKQFGEKP